MTTCFKLCESFEDILVRVKLLSGCEAVCYTNVGALQLGSLDVQCIVLRLILLRLIGTNKECQMNVSLEFDLSILFI